MAVNEGEAVVLSPEDIEAVAVLNILRIKVGEMVHIAEDSAYFPTPGWLDALEAGFEVSVHPILDPIPSVGVGG
jgi:hypothetical protein